MWFIPRIGTEIRLKDAWTCPLYDEHRNIQLIVHLGFIPPESDYLASARRCDFGRKKMRSFKHMFPAGTDLTVDRVYLRKADYADEYNSLSFRTKLLVGKKLKSFRFWAKLSDVRNMTCAEVKF